MARFFFIPSAVVLVTIFCIFHVDRPVTIFVQKRLYSNTHWQNLTSSIPDILLVMVVLVSIGSYVTYLLRKASHIHDKTSFLLKCIAISLPTAFAVKTILKFIFGRVETRAWLQNPQHYEFHLFQNSFQHSGFPSGHMFVFATLFATIWRCYPHRKILLGSLMTILGILLLATNYHFLSDLISGAYLGILVEAVIFMIMKKQWNNTVNHADRPATGTFIP